MKSIVIATNNPGKLTEFRELFAKFPAIKLRSQADYDLPSIEETGLSFVENAILKARHLANHTKLPTIADDSGLMVDALHGEPGIYSARYAGEKASAEENNQKLLNQLCETPKEQRQARFCCVLVYLRHAEDPLPIIAEGIWEGSILTAPQGTQGFGYDPIFYVPTHHCSAANLPLAIKNQLSHRGQALQKLLESLNQELA